MHQEPLIDGGNIYAVKLGELERELETSHVICIKDGDLCG